MSTASDPLGAGWGEGGGEGDVIPGGLHGGGGEACKPGRFATTAKGGQILGRITQKRPCKNTCGLGKISGLESGHVLKYGPSFNKNACKLASLA